MPFHEEPLHSLHVTSPSLASLTEFPEKYFQRLQRAGFTTVSEIILISPDSLKSQTGLSAEEVEEIYQKISEICSPKVSTISERIKTQDQHSFISLGSRELDQVFGNDEYDKNFSTNGIPTGMITEIAGESACGKTCMSLQLSLNVQLPYALGGLQGGCIYLCTESAFPSSRLYQMAVGLCERWKQNSSATSSGSEILEAINQLNADDLMDNVHLLRAQDPQALIHCIHYSLPAFLERQNNNDSSSGNKDIPTSQNKGSSSSKRKSIKLIILDSIGAIFRADFEQKKADTTRVDTKYRMTERASEMNQVADGLKFLADRYRLAVVVINQVSDVMDGSRWTMEVPSSSSPNRVSNIRQQEPSQNNKLPNHQQSPSSLSNPSSTPDSFGTLTPSTPTNNEPSDRLLVPLDYYQQARHFNGQKFTNNRKEAALGLAWTNAINIRIMLNKLNISPELPQQNPNSSNHQHPFIKNSSLTVREAVIVFSPFGKTKLDLSNRPVQFVILPQGIVSIKDLCNPIYSS